MINKSIFIQFVITSLLFILILLFSGLVLLGCGADLQVAGGGQSGTGITSGAISEFGSIYVNGIRFDTTQAQIYVEGQAVGEGDAATLDNLNIGQVVKVEGAIGDNSQGVAEKVFYDKSLEGPIGHIQQLDPYTRLLTIMGQQVIADNNTQWVNIDAHTLAFGMVVEVSGHLDDDDILISTFIAKKPDTMTHYTVKGAVTDLDMGQTTFVLQGLTVDFSAIAGTIPPLSEGDLVRVVGVLTTDDVFEASEITAWHPIGLPGYHSNPVVIAGFVNHFESVQNFYVDHYPVTTDEQTLFEDVDAEDLADGAGLVVYGTLQEGIVHADFVRLDEHYVFTYGTVETVNAADGTFTLAEAPTVLIRTSEATEISGMVDTFEALVPGDTVMVGGLQRPDGSISATEIYVMPADYNFNHP